MQNRAHYLMCLAVADYMHQQGDLHSLHTLFAGSYTRFQRVLILSLMTAFPVQQSSLRHSQQ